jgi:hypothetical protein
MAIFCAKDPELPPCIIKKPIPPMPLPPPPEDPFIMYE